jgi:hypothetical protein
VRRPARLSVVTQPGCTQFTSLLRRSHARATIGSPSPRRVNQFHWAKTELPRNDLRQRISPHMRR